MAYADTTASMIANNVVSDGKIAAAQLNSAGFYTATIYNCVAFDRRDSICGKGVPHIDLSAAGTRDDMVSAQLIIRDRYSPACAINAAHTVIIDRIVIDRECRVRRCPPCVVPDTDALNGWIAKPDNKALANAATRSRHGDSDMSEVFHLDCISRGACSVQGEHCRRPIAVE